jgi:anti-sigma-K factor RskA
MTDAQRPMTCDDVDELAPAFLLGAVDADESRAITAHLGTCERPHVELRSGVGGDLLALGLEPVAPPPALRDRLMATIERTPQDHAPVPSLAAPAGPRPRRELAPAPRAGLFDWLSNGWARGFAVAAVVAVIALGAWNVGLQSQLRDSQAVADAIAGARAVHTVTSDAGRGLLLETANGSAFVPADMASLPNDRVYEIWLIPATGAPVGVATFRPSDAPTLVQLERPLAGFTSFVVTVEPGFVQAPTGPAVMSLPLAS